jgi:flagellar biogenesis protein FliO
VLDVEARTRLPAEAGADSVCQEKRWKMIWAVAIVLGLLWVLGVGSSHAFGGFIHVLIIAALLLGAFRFIQSRRERRAP